MIRKILIPIAFLPSSTETLRWGAQLTRALHSDLTVLHVSHPRHHGPLQRHVTAQKLSEWGIEPPSFQLLREAETLLVNEGVLKLDEAGQVVERHSFKAIDQGLYEVHVKGAHGEDVRLRLREGPEVRQILKEAEDPSYDLILIGTRGRRGFRRYLVGNIAHEVALHAPCSVLVGKGLDRVRTLLVGVTARPSAQEALRQAVAWSKVLKLSLKLIAVAPQAEQREAARTQLEHAEQLARDLGASPEGLLRQGDPARQLLEAAGDDHLLVLGRTPLSMVQRVFLGDISQRILERGRCSVLLTVSPRLPSEVW